MKKYLHFALSLTLALTFIFNTSLLASGNTDVEATLGVDVQGRLSPGVLVERQFGPNINYGLIEVNENARGLSFPRTVSPNNGGTSWNFAGQANNSMLHTSHYVTGRTSYSVHVNNYHSSNTLRVRAGRVTTNILGIDGSSFFRTENVPSGGYAGWTLSGRDRTDRVFLEFRAPSNFSGSITG